MLIALICLDEALQREKPQTTTHAQDALRFDEGVRQLQELLSDYHVALGRKMRSKNRSHINKPKGLNQRIINDEE